MNKPESQINTLEEYMLPSQKANLAEILIMGEKWKEEGERLEEHRWERFSGEDFRKRCQGYESLLKQREEENKVILRAFKYDEWAPQTKRKFLEMYVNDLLIYSRDYIPVGQGVIVYLDSDRNDQLLRSENNRMTLRGLAPDIGLEGAEAIANMIERTGGLRKGVALMLTATGIGDEGVIVIMNAIKKTGGLKEGVQLSLGGNKLSYGGLVAIMEVIKEYGGFKKGVHINLMISELRLPGIELIAQTIVDVGGLNEGVVLDLYRTGGGTAAMEALVGAVEKTGGMPYGSAVSVTDNRATKARATTYSFDLNERINQINDEGRGEIRT